MSAANQVHVVLLEEARHDVRAEGEGYAPVVLAPSGDVLVGIRPQQITEQTAVGNLLKSANFGSQP